MHVERFKLKHFIHPLYSGHHWYQLLCEMTKTLFFTLEIKQTASKLEQLYIYICIHTYKSKAKNI